MGREMKRLTTGFFLLLLFVDSEMRLGGNGVTTEVALGDLDNDGDLDILVGNFRGEPEVWWNEAE